MTKLTHKLIDSLSHDPASKSAVLEVSDGEVPGLKLAVTKAGHKMWWFRFRIHSTKKMVKLGSYPALSLAESRQLALELKNQIHRGIDPTVQQQQQSVPTVSEFALQEYLPWAKLNKRSWMDDESRLRREVTDLIGQKPLHEVTTRDVMQVHSFVYQHHSAATANRYLSLLSKLFSLAIQWGHIERNPARGIQKYREAGPRHRWLSGDELKQFLVALDAEPNRITSYALKLLLQTGVRKMELLSLCWADVDLQNRSFRLQRTKSGKSRVVVLNSMAYELMTQLHSNKEEGCPWVFPARTGTGHLVDLRKPLQRAMDRANLQDLRPHDLRRSYASLLANAGVDIYQIKDLLGHSSVAVTQQSYAHLQQSTLRTATEVVARTLEETLRGTTEVYAGV